MLWFGLYGEWGLFSIFSAGEVEDIIGSIFVTGRCCMMVIGAGGAARVVFNSRNTQIASRSSSHWDSPRRDERRKDDESSDRGGCVSTMVFAPAPTEEVLDKAKAIIESGGDADGIYHVGRFRVKESSWGKGCLVWSEDELVIVVNNGLLTDVVTAVGVAIMAEEEVRKVLFKDNVCRAEVVLSS